VKEIAPVVASAEAHEGRETPGSLDTADYAIVVRQYKEEENRHAVTIKYSSVKDGVSVDISVFEIIDPSANLLTKIENLVNENVPGVCWDDLVAEITAQLR